MAKEPVEPTPEDTAPAPEPSLEEQRHADIANDHLNHAIEHGMLPGHEYNLHLHNATHPVTRRLLGSNSHGILVHEGKKAADFYPWTSIHHLSIAE